MYKYLKNPKKRDFIKMLLQVPHRQRLVWKLSNRTLRHLRPTDRLRPTLPKICEEAASAVGDKACQLRLR